MACESRLMRDAVTIVIVHLSRQQGQSPLHVRQELRLQACPDFFSAVDKPGHFVRPDPPVQREPIETSTQKKSALSLEPFPLLENIIHAGVISGVLVTDQRPERSYSAWAALCCRTLAPEQRKDSNDRQ